MRRLPADVLYAILRRIWPLHVRERSARALIRAFAASSSHDDDDDSGRHVRDVAARVVGESSPIVRADEHFREDVAAAFSLPSPTEAEESRVHCRVLDAPTWVPRPLHKLSAFAAMSRAGLVDGSMVLDFAFDRVDRDFYVECVFQQPRPPSGTAVFSSQPRPTCDDDDDVKVKLGLVNNNSNNNSSMTFSYSATTNVLCPRDGGLPGRADALFDVLRQKDALALVLGAEIRLLPPDVAAVVGEASLRWATKLGWPLADFGSKSVVVAAACAREEGGALEIVNLERTSVECFESRLRVQAVPGGALRPRQAAVRAPAVGPVHEAVVSVDAYENNVHGERILTGSRRFVLHEADFDDADADLELPPPYETLQEERMRGPDGPIEQRFEDGTLLLFCDPPMCHHALYRVAVPRSFVSGAIRILRGRA